MLVCTRINPLPTLPQDKTRGVVGISPDQLVRRMRAFQQEIGAVGIFLLLSPGASDYHPDGYRLPSAPDPALGGLK